jgi:chitodextrinase
VNNAGSAVYFNGSASFDPDGNITGYTWDFGDGMIATGATVTTCTRCILTVVIT